MQFQKVVFWLVKGHLLDDKRPPFVIRKAAFWKKIDYILIERQSSGGFSLVVRQDENKYHGSCDKQHGLSRYVLHRHDGGLHRHPAFKRNGGQLFGFQSAFAAGLSYKFCHGEGLCGGCVLTVNGLRQPCDVMLLPLRKPVGVYRSADDGRDGVAHPYHQEHVRGQIT